MTIHKAVIVTLALGASACGAESCGPTPTKSVYTEQRKTPYFKVLVYEIADTSVGGGVSFILFEDGAGNCFITSGTDGGIQNAPPSSCEKAKETLVEKK